ncbi:ATP-binding cassette sub-family D member 4 [Cokeromyces recurvatus]|uniref:ATP-binding cassette sub-family D member 4 n=1 Tax=Cokeromyces recurvatus TaxID=90255 RepID=UPI002220EAEE|nr:ATP-binding cassette sub-family D member 4 [Cokeromyces recurvatus]KAI7902855.1 ATP-binding cassette sub-family D member 4 [Cokeromyces recurvatus]
MRQERLDSFSSQEPILNHGFENQSHDIEKIVSRKQDYRFDRLFFKRLHRLLKILFDTKATTTRRKSLLWLYIVFVVTAIGYEVLVYYVGLMPSRFYTILTSRDAIEFSKYILPCLILVFSTATCKSLLNFIGGLFSLKSRKILTLHVQDCYIKKNFMYTLVMNHEEEIDHPDQRITQDIDKFSETLGQIITSLIITPILLIYYIYQCWKVTGFSGPFIIFIYFLLGSVVSRRFIQPIVNAVFYKELQEGSFRSFHVRLCQFVESIAFCEGEKNEHKYAYRNLNTLLAYQRTIVNKELPLKMVNESFSYFGSVLNYLIIAIPIFTGALDGKDATELSSIISANSFVAMYLIFLFSTIIEQSSKLSDLAGYTARIGELLEMLDQISEEVKKLDYVYYKGDSDTMIEFEHLTLFTPQHKRLIVRDFNLKIYEGEHVAIIGPNGSGKTSILRTLACIWPCQEGKISISYNHQQNHLDSNNMMFLPQLPYFIDGSLRDQILYPYNTTLPKSTNITDEDIVYLLEKVHLNRLSGLIQSYDTVYSQQEWNKKLLSPGEQQRFMFARLFYWKPRFAVLDEATSAMDKEMANNLYKTLMCTTTVISVSHRPEIIDLHRILVHLDGNGGYTVEEKERFY